MRTSIQLAVCLALGSLGAATDATQAHAQGPLGPAARAFHSCTFNQPCNWASHATIAFGAAYALHRLHVSPPAAAGAAALFYVGKEVRDHLRWGVLGSMDSNADLLSGCAGALLAYYLVLRPPEDPLARFAIELGASTRLMIQLDAP